MKLKKILEFIENVGIKNPGELEVYCNESIVFDVELQGGKIILKIENPIDQFYEYQGKLFNLKKIINELKEDNIISISEIEAVDIAHNLELDCVEVVGELTKNHILINKGE